MLARRGYDVSFTMGNSTPVAELMVGHPKSGNLFLEDVKAQRQRTGFFATTKAERPNLYYILVYVGR